MIAEPLPAATGWPPSVTVGVGVGGTDGAAGPDVALWLELADLPDGSVSTWKSCQMTTAATTTPMTAFQLNCFFFPGGRLPPPERVSPSRAVKPKPRSAASVARPLGLLSIISVAFLISSEPYRLRGSPILW